MTGRGACFEVVRWASARPNILLASRRRPGSITTVARYLKWPEPQMAALTKNLQRRVLQQHNRLRIDDAAVGDHGERFVERKLQHLDLLPFVREAAAGAHAHRRQVFGDEEVHLFGDRSRA